jgi:hypothetical protein
VPQVVSVVPPASTDLGQGQVTSFIFEATDTQRFVSSVSPTSATLSTGQKILVKVAVSTPATAPVGARDTLTFNAIDKVNPEVRNFAIITSSVIASKRQGDVNLDGEVDCRDLNLVKASFGSRAGSRAFNPDVDVDVNGWIDIRDYAFVARQLPVGTRCK